MVGDLPGRPTTARVLGAWVAVVGAALVVGAWWIDGDAVQLRAAPLYGRWSWHPGAELLPAIAVGAAGAWWGPAVAGWCRWRVVPLLAGAWATLWALALAASDGWSAVTAPLVSRHEYEPFATGVDDLGAFVRTYVDELPTYPIHVQGHPPGPVVLAWLLDRVGLSGAGWLAALALLAWGAAVAAALVAARAVAGEQAARRAAPAVALLPAAVWAGTSFDALFAALVAAATAALMLAVTHRSLPWATAAGIVAGLALLSSYGAAAALLPAALVALTLSSPFFESKRPPDGSSPSKKERAVSMPTLAAVPAGPATALAVGASGSGAVAVATEPGLGVADLWRAVRVWVVAAVGVGLPLVVAAAAGFWWPAGLAATGERYWAGIGAERPALYLTFLGNPAALALATGPAVAAGLWTIRRRAALLPYAALVAVVIADLSQMSRGEVERIWLPFVPLLALAAPGDRRGWLAAQVGVALALQSTLITPW